MSRPHWGSPPVTVGVTLAEPADRNQAAGNQMIEGGRQPLPPGIGQQGTALTGEVGQPVSQAGAGKVGTGPASSGETLGQMGTDHLNRGPNPREMGIRAQGDDAATLGTAATLQVEGGGKTLEIARDEAVAPDTIMAATGTALRQFPRIIFAQLKNVLELHGNRIYHTDTWYGGITPRSNGAESSAKTLCSLYFRDKKRPLEKAQIIRQPVISCQSILKISLIICPIYCGSLQSGDVPILLT